MTLAKNVAQIVLTMTATLASTSAVLASPYQGSSFDAVWDVAQEGRYETLPQYKVTTASFFGFLKDNLQAAASRTLKDEADILPPFRKLLHANGVCLAGTWAITEDSPYTGYFAKGAQGLIVARASVALSETRLGQKRPFGLAGKIFPTMSPGDTVKTANFFVIDNLGGTFIPNFRDTAMTNDISNLQLGPANTPNLLVAAAAGRALKAAEDALGGGNPFIRQLYPISELGLADTSRAVTPLKIRLQGEPGPRGRFEDFRDELLDSIQESPIRFSIEVTVPPLSSASGSSSAETSWMKLGVIEFTAAEASLGCDQRVHFAHPKWRK